MIGHANCSLKGVGRNYFTSNKEILAIIYCLNKFHGYLVGQNFEILSDNNRSALSFLLHCKLTNARMLRWINAIQEDDFTIKYCEASYNKTIDTLSRYQPVIEEIFASKNNEVKILAINYKYPNELKVTITNIKNKEKLDTYKNKLHNKINKKTQNNYLIFNDILHKLIDGQ